MQQSFILGLSHVIPDSAFYSTEALYDLVGHNTGNLAFHHAINRQLGGALSVVSWYAAIEEINSMPGIGVMPCANQLGAHADYGSLAGKFKDVEKKLVAIGLGAQAAINGDPPEIPEGTVKWVEEIIRRAPTDQPNISVRGNFTLESLRRYGLDKHAVALGCPTLFINPDPALGRTIEQRVSAPMRIAVAAGHQRWKGLARIEQSLTRLVSATGGAYISQSPLEMVKLTRHEVNKLPSNTQLECRDYICPELNMAEFYEWTRRHGRAFFDISSWMESLRGFDFVIGARIHGVMLALQAGIPGICIAHDARTLELCQTMKVPFVLPKDIPTGINRDSIATLFNFNAKEFDANSASLCSRYIDFLLGNSLSPAEYLYGIAGRAVPDESGVKQ